MNPASPSDDAALNELLLSKADALIRRNRPDGVRADAEELPLLTDAVEDLPELTDAIVLPPHPRRTADTPPDIDHLVREAVAHEVVRMQAAHEHALREASERLRADALAGQSDLIEQTREEMRVAHEQILHEATRRLGEEAAKAQALAVETALARSGEEAEARARSLVEQARHEAKVEMKELLVEVDAHLAQAIEQWMTTELPQIISAELAGMVERLRESAGAHMRATLLPRISDKLSGTLADPHSGEIGS